MYMFILMSSGWYCKHYETLRDAMYDAQDHIDQGNTVAFGDSRSYFADQIKINRTDIKDV